MKSASNKNQHLTNSEPTPMKKDSFIFYRSFYEATQYLEKDQKADLFEAISNYALNQEETKLDNVCNALFSLIKPQLDANQQRYINGKKGADHGKKGGRPKTPKKPLTNPKLTPNVNVNGNVNVNVNDNVNDNVVKKVNKKKDSVFSSFDNFWNCYDKKVGSQDKIKKKWDLLDQKQKDEIMKYIPEYKKAVPNKRYRKNPDTFLNNQSWKDEIIKDETKTNTRNNRDQQLHNNQSRAVGIIL